MNLMELIESTGGYVKGRVLYRDLIPYVLDGYGTLLHLDPRGGAPMRFPKRFHKNCPAENFSLEPG